MQKALIKEYKQVSSLQDNLVEEKHVRPETPNPWYHHQKRKLVLRYQKHLLEKEYAAAQQEQASQKQDHKRKQDKKSIS